ncbi:MAG: sulfite exporter TauE/SafE family protein [Pirellulaceae bacterium]
MGILLGSVFLASLLGSLHCVGMCGPFALLAGTDVEHRRSAMIPTAAYSFGRLVTYSIVGVIFGALGLALNAGTSFASWQQTATWVAGGLMIAVGVIALARQLGYSVRLPGFGQRLQKFLNGLFRRAKDQPPVRRAFVIGALSSLMPCGWLYTFAIVAAGTGSPLSGAAVMAVFWAGTVPIMVMLVLGTAKVSQSVQQRLPVAMASLVILVGVFTIAFRAPVAIGGDTAVADREDLVTQVQSIEQSELPCCHDE